MRVVHFGFFLVALDSYLSSIYRKVGGCLQEKKVLITHLIVSDSARIYIYTLWKRNLNKKKPRKNIFPVTETIAVIVYKFHKSLRFDITKTYPYHVHTK